MRRRMWNGAALHWMEIDGWKKMGGLQMDFDEMNDVDNGILH